jgi:penicillin-binding protein 1B
MRAWNLVRYRSKIALAAKVVLSVVPLSLALVTAEALVRAHLDGTGLRGPTRLYARPLVIQQGMMMERSTVEEHLKRLGYTRSRSRRQVAVGEFYLGYDTWTIGRRAFRHQDWVHPGGVAVIRIGHGDRVTGLRDADGRSLRSAFLDPELIGIYGSSQQDRIPVGLSDIPHHLLDAVLAIEDQRFFEHGGLDLRRILGAALANLRARRIVQGASTLTQQLAKNLFLSAERSPIRKMREATMALALEARYDKGTILQAYLNEIYLGQDGALAIHGVGSAARHYFGKDVSQLDLAESALLAGIIRGPSIYSPFRHREAAKRRRDMVLQLMLSRELISDGEFRDAKRSQLELRRAADRTRSGRYFVDFVVSQLQAEHGRKVLDNGLAVFTTLDMRLQRAAEEAVRRGLERLEAYYPRLTRDGDALQAALVALDPRNGELLAMVGGRDYGSSQFNRAVYARRQPGSSFKPIVAMAALSRSKDRNRDAEATFTLATTLEDGPFSVETPAGLWEPANYDNRFHGETTIRNALERSLNVPFARLGLMLGPKRIARTAQDLGIQSQLRLVPSLALGSSEVTPMEMARAYGVFAAAGYRADLSTTIGVLDHSGNALSKSEHTGGQVFTPAEAYLLTSALEGAVQRGTGRGLRSMGYRGPVAAKSGTTNDFRDAWFIGYAPSISVSVWVGFDDGRSIGLSGSRAAMPIFARFLIDALGRYGGKEFTVPRGLEIVEVNRQTGMLAGPGCRGEAEVFLTGTAPTESCSRYWAPSRRYGNDRSRWYERLVGPLIAELRRSLQRDRR